MIVFNHAGPFNAAKWRPQTSPNISRLHAFALRLSASGPTNKAPLAASRTSESSGRWKFESIERWPYFHVIFLESDNLGTSGRSDNQPTSWSLLWWIKTFDTILTGGDTSITKTSWKTPANSLAPHGAQVLLDPGSHLPGCLSNFTIVSIGSPMLG